MLVSDPIKVGRFYRIKFVGMVAFIGSGFLLYYIRKAWILKIPKLSLMRDGFHYRGFINNLFLKWSAVGPFSVCERSVRLKKVYFICAFVRSDNNDASSQNSTGNLSFGNADIQIPLQYFPVGKTLETAQKLVSTLNAWRDKYGTPDNYDHSKSIEIETRKNLDTDKKKRELLSGMVLIIAFCFFILWVVALYMDLAAH